MPFGFTSRQQQAWMMSGGGQELMDDLFKGYNIVGRFAGNTGAQMAAGTARKSKRPTTSRA